MLRCAHATVSGELLSDRLGVSRVAVWKHIHGLRELGYDIQAGPGGYRLEKDPDALFPWEFPGREDRVHYFDEIPSTMDVARDLARRGCPDFTVVAAGRQTQGRGRLQRTWQSAEGGLYVTLVLRPAIPPARAYRVNFAVSLVLAETLQACFGLDAKLKWPNDVLVDGKKISGMLSQMETEADTLAYLNIGLGVNVNNDPTPVEPGATSVRLLLSREVSRKKLLAELLDRIEERLAGSLEGVVERWKARTVTLNRPVRIVTAGETFEGLAVDVDKDGALVLRLGDGSPRRVIYGDCFHSAGT